MKIGAVLPLSVNGSYGSDDLLRANMLFASLTKFAEKDLFERILVVTPDHQRDLVEQSLSCWGGLPIQVVSELSLLPELKKRRSISGWRLQQLVKIVAAKYFESDFYLALDADVLCTGPFSLPSLIFSGKAILQKRPRDGHWKWWRAASYILNAPYSRDSSDLGMGVTPAVLSRSIVLALLEELDNFGKHSWVENICSIHSVINPKNLTFKRYVMRKWTEYSLYYLFAEKNNLLNEYHIDERSLDGCAVLSCRITENSELSNVATVFSKNNPAVFVVINSKEFPNPNVVLEKVKKYIGGDLLNQAAAYAS